ncbi:MAG: type I-C CRISPR-associated protein Cas8c/Csd1 [Faecousia sp.]
MGLLQQAYETYTAMESQCMGIYKDGQKEPLCPPSHIITAAQIEITLDRTGNFVCASAVDKSEQKTIIPATEDSAGRTSAPCAHPLCDQLGYLGGHDDTKFELYLTQLGQWASSAWGHPKLNAVLRYVQGGTILSDLQKNGLITLTERGVPEKEKLLVRWRVQDPYSSAAEECWRDISLFRSFINYYASQQREKRFCMVSGEEAPAAKQHPKGIISINGNAKLISANDSSGFTYRGRFSEDWQAASVSYEVSQKAHAAIRWVAANQGVLLGGRTFLCWSPQGVTIPQPHTSFLKNTGEIRRKPSDYREELKKTLLGKKEELPRNAKAVIAAFDAATTGRLSVTYYNELQASDFLDRLHNWDTTCCWWNGPFGVKSPYLNRIVDCAFGVQRTELGKTRLVTDDGVMAQQLQRLIACRVDGARIPQDLVQAVVNRASNPLALEMPVWRNVVFTACAVIQKYYAPMLKEDICMEWELDRPDRSFQFGRLLAVMDRAEADYYYKADEDRQTNAIKSLAAFKKTPLDVFERVNCQLENAYLYRIKPWQRNRYRRLRGEIVAILSTFSREELNKPLDSFYLIGYELQRNAFFNQNDTTENEEE